MRVKVAVSKIDTAPSRGYAHDMAQRATMNVSITPELERFVKRLVEGGRFQSASEVFREGLRMLETAERHRLLEKALLEGLTPEEESSLEPTALDQARKDLDDKIQEGIQDLNEGRKLDGEAYFASWKDRLARHAAGARRAERKHRR